MLMEEPPQDDGRVTELQPRAPSVESCGECTVLGEETVTPDGAPTGTEESRESGPRVAHCPLAGAPPPAGHSEDSTPDPTDQGHHQPGLSAGEDQVQATDNHQEVQEKEEEEEPLSLELRLEPIHRSEMTRAKEEAREAAQVRVLLVSTLFYFIFVFFCLTVSWHRRTHDG